MPSARSAKTEGRQCGCRLELQMALESPGRDTDRTSGQKGHVDGISRDQHEQGYSECCTADHDRQTAILQQG